MPAADEAMMKLTAQKIAAFRKSVYRYYAASGRCHLPWRGLYVTPYHVFISEVMLQQTQVDRVIDKFTQFIERFPDFESLARAPLATVLQAWQGLGYNRRALYLQKSAQKIVDDHGGVLPDDPAVLETLPGIGAATAASICAFGFNKPTVFIETNIRSVFIHHFFNDAMPISDEQIRPLVITTLDVRHAARWYSALMDYGVHLKKTYGNPSRKSTHHVKQSKFEGSDRQIRGRIVRELTKRTKMRMQDMVAAIDCSEPDRVLNIVDGLVRDGLVSRTRRRLQIASR